MEISNEPSRSLATRTLVAVAVVALALAATGGWLFVHDRTALNIEPRLRTEKTDIEAKLAAVRGKIEVTRTQIPVEQDRALRAGKVVAELKQLESTWDRLFGDREQQRVNRERLARMQAMQTDATARAAGLQEELTRAKWERDGLEIERDRIDAQLREEEARKSTVRYYLGRAWLRTRSWIFFGLALYLVGLRLVSLVRKRQER